MKLLSTAEKLCFFFYGTNESEKITEEFTA